MFTLSPEGTDFVKKEMQRYETKLSAVIPCLYRIQDENNGWVSAESISYLSQLMDINESKILEVMSFYTMFNSKPVGPLHIQVCCNVSCSMAGSRELLETLKIKFADKNKDNKVCTFTEVECLGSCDTAPVVQINRDPYIEHAQSDDLQEIIERKCKIEKNSNSSIS